MRREATAEGRELGVFQLLRILAGLYPAWASAALVLLGLLCYCIEGLGISLFIPLLQSIGDPAAQFGRGGVLGLVLQPFAELQGDRRWLIIGGVIFASTVLKNLIGLGNAILHAALNNRITHQLRSAIVRQLLALSHSYIDSRQSGELMNTLMTETWRTGSALSAFVGLLTALSAVLVFGALLLLLSWRLTLIVALFTLLISLADQWATGKAKRLGEAAVRANTRLATRMWELFGGMKVIRAFGREAYETGRFDAASSAVRDTFFRLAAVSSINNPVHEVLSVLLLLGILLHALAADRGSLPVLVAFSVILFRLQPQIRAVSGSWLALSAASSSVGDVMGLLDAAGKTYIRSGHLPVGRLRYGIAFEQVGFRYPGGETEALRDITALIEAGRTTALVGPSGAGKTTLVNLLCRFYEADRGEILIDGQPIRDLDLAAWRDQIGIVSQDIYMFGATVAENIAYGAPGADRARIEEAARLADADGFIRHLPLGYDTRIGDGGLSLSGGQRQRIALARAIIRAPQILILDEATNALDSLSEHLIRDALDHFGRDRTVIIIAHRFSTIERADRILVLDQGGLVEQGELRQLKSGTGLFRRMYLSQTPLSASAD